MNEQNQPAPQPQNIVVDTLVRIGEVIVRTFSAVIEWAWETWKSYWLLIIGLIVLGFILYSITKPGWDEVAAGRSFWLSEFAAKNKFMQECLASDLYTYEECFEWADKRR
jgi:hypothetical protein